jgi:hypothetical protein
MTGPDFGSDVDRYAAGEIDSDDVRVLERMARLYDRVDPVPSGLVDKITFGLTLEALHAEVAQLQRAAALSGVRGDGDTETAQTITFTSAHLTTLITISSLSPERVRLDGWVVPGEGVTVELRRRDGSVTVECDQDGRFVFPDVARGVAQFVLRPGTSGAPVVTPSVEL